MSGRQLGVGTIPSDRAAARAAARHPSGDRAHYRALRLAVQSAAEATAGVREAVNPFGFELFGSGYAPPFAALRRFFVYLRLRAADAAPGSAEAAEHAFAANLLNVLPAVGCAALRDAVRLVVTSSGTRILCGAGHSSVHVRVVAGSGSLLDDYARYLTTMPAAVTSRLLPEIGGFDASPAARRFVYQVTVIGARLFGDVRSAADGDLLALREAIAGCGGRDLETGVPARQPPTAEDHRLLREVVAPLNAAWSGYLTGGARTSLIRIRDFHSAQTYRVTVSDEHVAGRAERIAAAYTSFAAGTLLSGHHQSKAM